MDSAQRPQKGGTKLEMSNSQSAVFSFELPQRLLAREPAEERGASRRDVRLMVLDRGTGRVVHTNFENLEHFLEPGDLLVFNSSRTMPASLEGYDSERGLRIELRLAEHLIDESWLALLSCREGEPFACGLREGMEITFGPGLSCIVESKDETIPRLWKIRFSQSGTELINALYSLGKPIRYEYLSSDWNLEYFQNVYSNQPGSLEMPSAGRAFTWRGLYDLKRHGVRTAFILLHASLSSYNDEELDSKHPISEEEYSIGEQAARQVNSAHRRGKRVIAVGTTVVRALESRADMLGIVSPTAHSYTKLQVTAEHRLRAVDGLLTGLHEPRTTHLDLLSAFTSPERIRVAYEEAVRLGYRWHEFGDLNLII